MSDIPVSKIMSTNVAVLYPNNTVLDASQIMDQRHIGSVTVMQDGKAVGIFTRTDLRRYDRRQYRYTHLSEAMSRDPLIIPSETPVSKVIDIMNTKKYGSVLIGDNGVVKGIVTRGDVKNRLGAATTSTTNHTTTQEDEYSLDSNTQTDGGDKMTDKNNKPEIKERGSNLISGLPDAIFLKNKYQKELDDANNAIVDMVHSLEDDGKKTKESLHIAKGLRKDMDAHETERSELYKSLGNLLTKETDFESKMWNTTQKGQKVKTINLKQKFSDSDVDEMNYNAMQEYIKQYPEYASKSSFKKILEKIEEKEKEITAQKNKYNKAVSRYNYLLSFFEKNIQKAKDKFELYEDRLKEAEGKISKTKYRNSVFYKVASEKTKQEVNLDLSDHRINQFRNTLNIIEKENSENKGKTFKEMDY